MGYLYLYLFSFARKDVLRLHVLHFCAVGGQRMRATPTPGAGECAQITELGHAAARHGAAAA